MRSVSVALGVDAGAATGVAVGFGLAVSVAVGVDVVEGASDVALTWTSSVGVSVAVAPDRRRDEQYDQQRDE